MSLEDLEGFGEPRAQWEEWVPSFRSPINHSLTKWRDPLEKIDFRPFFLGGDSERSALSLKEHTVSSRSEARSEDWLSGSGEVALGLAELALGIVEAASSVGAPTAPASIEKGLDHIKRGWDTLISSGGE